jgi:hypothetical protein
MDFPSLSPMAAFSDCSTWSECRRASRTRATWDSRENPQLSQMREDSTVVFVAVGELLWDALAFCPAICRIGRPSGRKWLARPYGPGVVQLNLARTRIRDQRKCHQSDSAHSGVAVDSKLGIPWQLWLGLQIGGIRSSVNI